jgi:hypothetical protein
MSDGFTECLLTTHARRGFAKARRRPECAPRQAWCCATAPATTDAHPATHPPQRAPIHKPGHDSRARWGQIASYDVGALLVIETTRGASFDFGMDGLANGSEVRPPRGEEVTTATLLSAVGSLVVELRLTRRTQGPRASATS